MGWLALKLAPLFIVGAVLFWGGSKLVGWLKRDWTDEVNKSAKKQRSKINTRAEEFGKKQGKKAKKMKTEFKELDKKTSGNDKESIKKRLQQKARRGAETL